LNKPFYILFFVLATIFCRAQTNLVPNGSFEDYYSCPIGQDELFNCIGWRKANLSTTDYVNSCSGTPSDVNAPHYFMGYQLPFQGTAYCGIGAYVEIEATPAEYAQVKLSEKLKPFHKYKLSMRIVLANHSSYVVNNFGAYVSKLQPYSGSFDSFNYVPQLLTGAITDTANWTSVSQEFVSIGEEEYLTIGRFDYAGPPVLQTVIPDTNIAFPDKYSYYLIDSVNLYDVSTANNLTDLPTIFSPNNDGTNDLYYMPNFNFFIEQEMLIFNRWGNEMAKLSAENDSWNGTYNGNNVSDGVYYYIYWASGEDGKKYEKKGFIQLVR